jgi:mRNA deadenylase 3'-5' endonuclease subunit Ccr4
MKNQKSTGVKNQKYCEKLDNNENRKILKREWINVAEEPSEQGLAFTVLNYNILSQQLLDMHYRNAHALQWNQRIQSIVGEIIKEINPDFLCCQVKTKETGEGEMCKKKVKVQ